MEKICEACEQAPGEIIEVPDDPKEPYRLCAGCHRRLTSHSLRPREWYNLGSIHGRLNDLLSDEFYDESDGTALQPEDEVVDAGLFPCPTLEEVSGSPKDLLTYLLTRREIHEGDVSALGSHSPESLLPVFSESLRGTASEVVAGRIFRLVGLTLGTRGAALVLDNWERFASTGAFGDLAFAASRCLPLEEGHAKVTAALSGMDLKERLISKNFLACFRTRLNLDWVEENVRPPIDITWGPLVAASQFDWERARKWLSSGRPLSLVALDALYSCGRGRREPPLLLNPPGSREFVSTLEEYLSRDNVPRVRKNVAFLLELREWLTDPEDR
jgi:hypothetical protein